MPQVNITFAIETNTGATSGRISTTEELSDSLYSSLHESVYRGTRDAENWIKNNLFGLVVSQTGVTGDWKVISPMITKR
jgi:hypothetical protein